MSTEADCRTAPATPGLLNIPTYLLTYVTVVTVVTLVTLVTVVTVKLNLQQNSKPQIWTTTKKCKNTILSPFFL